MEMNNQAESCSNACSAIPRYSKQEAEALAVKLLKKETFREALQILIAWLEDGQCSESNALHFYTLIQLCWNYMKKLQDEQEFFEEALKARVKSCSIQLYLDEIEDVFKAIEKENIWDNFTETQIEEIREMRKDIEDLKKNYNTTTEEEESTDMANISDEDVQSENDAHEVQTKAGSLTCGLNTVERTSEPPQKRCKECQNEILKLRSQLENSRNALLVHQNEMAIIAGISCFLFENSDGANIDSIYSYLNNRIRVTSTKEIEETMRKYPRIFMESSPVEATGEKKWTCISISQESMALLREGRIS